MLRLGLLKKLVFDSAVQRMYTALESPWSALSSVLLASRRIREVWISMNTLIGANIPH
jgi:hypothetical protein